MYVIKPHKGQESLIFDRKRFNHIKCGRRWGKTFFINYLCARAFINEDKNGKEITPFLIGIWFPTYKDLEHVWQKLNIDFEDVISHKSEQLKQIHTVPGGRIDFWSMSNPDSGRGLHYNRVILDEFCKALKNQLAWKHTIRPTLTDLKGDAWLFSTPKGKRNYFYTMQRDHQNDDNWAFFKFTTYDNPYLDPDEIDEARNQLDSVTFDQEYLAEDVDASERPFLYSYNFDVHVSDKKLEIDPDLPVWISFDFNVDPQTCVVAQRIDSETLHILRLIRLENASVYEMAAEVKKIPNYLIATGDSTGKSRSTSNNLAPWEILRTHLNLGENQLQIRSRNLDHKTSRIICNSVLEHKTILIDPGCDELISDCEMAAVDENGNLIKDELNGMHFFDGFRYLLDANWPEILSEHL